MELLPACRPLRKKNKNQAAALPRNRFLTGFAVPRAASILFNLRPSCAAFIRRPSGARGIRKDALLSFFVIIYIY